jgi:hypothetical protein
VHFLRFLGLVCLALSCTDALTESRNMPIGPITAGSYVTVTPDATPAPLASVTAPTASMPVTAVDIQALALQMLNGRTEQMSNTAALAAATGYPDGYRIYVHGNKGLYTRSAAGTPYASDGYWLIAAADGGQWIHESWGGTTSQNIAYIGPSPGETTLSPTPTLRINPQFIPRGWFSGSAGAAPAALTNSTIDATLGTGSLADYGGTHFADLGTLNTLDEIRFTASACVASAIDFSLGVYVTDSTGTYPLSTGAGGIPAYTASGAGRNVAVPIAFAYTVAGNGNVKVYFKGNVISAGTASLIVSGFALDVYRP